VFALSGMPGGRTAADEGQTFLVAPLCVHSDAGRQAGQGELHPEFAPAVRVAIDAFAPTGYNQCG